MVKGRLPKKYWFIHLLFYFLCLSPFLPLSLSPLSPPLSLQGASKNGKAPDGSSYLDCAEGDEVKALLKWPLIDPTHPLTHQPTQPAKIHMYTTH